MAHDSVVADHYSGFDLSKAHIVRLDRDRMMYVSYRLGDRVFWTNRTLKLFKGEALITDGTLEARARCGNRLSAIAMQPTSPRQPMVEAMEAEQPPEESTNNLPLDLLPQPLLNLSPPSGGPSGGSPSGIVPPTFVPLVGGGSSVPPYAPPGPPTPPIATPEPSVALLVVAGFSAVFLLYLRKRRVARHPKS